MDKKRLEYRPAQIGGMPFAQILHVSVTSRKRLPLWYERWYWLDILCLALGMLAGYFCAPLALRWLLVRL